MSPWKKTCKKIQPITMKVVLFHGRKRRKYLSLGRDKSAVRCKNNVVVIKLAHSTNRTAINLLRLALAENRRMNEKAVRRQTFQISFEELQPQHRSLNAARRLCELGVRAG